jgi:fucokinase
MELQGHFLHLGTTRQYRDTITGRENDVARELFSSNVLARIDWSVDRTARVFASVLLDCRGSVGRGAVIEHSLLGGNIHIGDDSVVSQVESTTHFDLPDQTLLFQAPVRGGLNVHVVCGAADDFKGKFADGKCLYLNAPIKAFMQRNSIAPSDLWRGVPVDQRTLWTARLFPATHKRDALDQAIWLAQPKPATKMQIDTWRKSTRYSMSMVLESVDADALIAHREAVTATLQTLDFLSRIDADEDVSPETVISHYVSGSAYEAVKRIITRYATAPAVDATVRFRQARAWWALATLGKRPDRMLAGERASSESKAFAKIAEASENVGASIDVRENRGKIKPGQTIEARSPVRIDLAGGWSDTPPHCYERGGAVVNVAIDLDDGPPVRATVKTTRQERLILHSVDLGRKSEITQWNADAPVDLHDPLAMHKVAMRLAGLCPTSNEPIGRWLSRIGCGLEVRTECRVPKGSGLGTSSILAATLLAALYRAQGIDRSESQLINDTLLLEQRLGTGGGWQDQAGGIVGGAKITTSAPGVPQVPVVRRLKLSAKRIDELESRLVVCFSGQQRLARDILRRVMGRWLGREPAMMGLMHDLIHGARTLAAALEAGRWSVVGKQIANYWRIKKDLYPASTTPSVDVLFSECRDLCLACGLAGAGGGGFGYFFCRDAKQGEELRTFLADRLIAPGMMGSVYHTKINRHGLDIRVINQI